LGAFSRMRRPLAGTVRPIPPRRKSRRQERQARRWPMVVPRRLNEFGRYVALVAIAGLAACTQPQANKTALWRDVSGRRAAPAN
jgi:hypothetical protein